jgi:hypothetical protein
MLLVDAATDLRVSMAPPVLVCTTLFMPMAELPSNLEPPLMPFNPDPIFPERAAFFLSRLSLACGETWFCNVACPPFVKKGPTGLLLGPDEGLLEPKTPNGASDVTPAGLLLVLLSLSASSCGVLG